MEKSKTKTGKKLKNSVNEVATPLLPQLIDVSDSIWEFAEEPFKEFKSAALLREVLAERGFSLEREFKDIPTAFAMTWRKGARPRVGILAEYDALPDCGLRKGAWGHGCGHNLLGAGSTLAALIVQGVMQKHSGIRGSVTLLGAPAEETLAGKVYMARDGAFDDFDAVFAWHPSNSTQVKREGGSAMDSLVFEFFGKTAHGASAHLGRSALDAAELMDHAVNVLREHVPENVRIHSIITSGGVAPNVVPEYARSWYYVRGKDRKQVDEITARVVKCARGAATATETRFKKTLLTAIYSRLPNDALAEHLDHCLKLMGRIPFNKKDEDALKTMGIKGRLDATIKDIANGADRGSSDEDSVSWLAPLGRLKVACWPEGIAGHHRDTTRMGKASFAHKGMAQAGKFIALGALGFMTDAGLRARVKREFKRRTKDFTYDPLIPEKQLPPIRDRIPTGSPP